jgi:CxxC motif-containing protein
METEKIEIKPLVRYKGKIVKIDGNTAIARLKDEKDPQGLERNIILQLSEIKAETPVECGNLIYVDVIRDKISGMNSIKEDKYIVYH